MGLLLLLRLRVFVVVLVMRPGVAGVVAVAVEEEADPMSTGRRTRCGGEEGVKVGVGVGVWFVGVLFVGVVGRRHRDHCR